MKIKRGILSVILILSFLTILPLIIAQNSTEEDQAYSCLKSKLGENCGGSNSIEQLSFSILAMGYDSDIQEDCKLALGAKREDDSWGDDDIKDTAQAILALNHIGVDVEAPVDWLLTKRELTEELNWFLQIDSNNATDCEISKNDANSEDFEVLANKKVSGSSNCLSPAVAEQNYFFQIDEDCFDDTFTISCDRDFVTSVFYKMPGTQIYFVSSETHSAPSDGETKEKISSYCFAPSSTANCDYEGSLWASLALAKAGKDVGAYIPYISAKSEENDEYLPSAFLYLLTEDDDYYTELVDQQKQGKFWEETTSQKFYDTALALLALQGTSIQAVDDTKEYLFDIQDDSGCWNSNNILETAFLLFAGWPKDPDISISGRTRDDCEPTFSCLASASCTDDDTLSSTNYYCSGIGDVCCRTGADLETCEEKQGTICESDQTCSLTEVLAQDTNYCCLGDCLIVLDENECEQASYSCKESCSSSEEERSAYSSSCDFGDVCCADKGGGGGLGLIILLILLIILVVLAIIFRDQVKIWYFKIKSKFKFGKGPSSISTSRPSPPPGEIPQFGGSRQIIPRQPTRRMPQRRVPRRAQKDTVFDETMKKLRDMTK